MHALGSPSILNPFSSQPILSLKLHSMYPMYPIFGGLVFLVLLNAITPTKRVAWSAS